MVFFTCNACGSSLKKSQVEKHWRSECRNCEVLSCIDCGKDFYGDEYVEHTKCISEAQKYQGALYKGSSGGGKGEKKQQEWLEKVRQSMSSATVSPKLARLLERIAEFPNIPRKKAKFVNFVRNSVKIWDSRTLEELWEAFSGANDQPSSSSQPSNHPCQEGNPPTSQGSPLTATEPTELGKPGRKNNDNPDDSWTDSKPVVEWKQDTEPTKYKKRKRKYCETNGQQKALEEAVPSGSIIGDTAVSTKEDTDTPRKKKKKKTHKEAEGDDPLLKQRTSPLLEAVSHKEKKKHKHLKEECSVENGTDVSGIKRGRHKESFAEQEEGVKRPKLDESIAEGCSVVTSGVKKSKRKHKHKDSQ